jgi:N-acetylglucosaminyldiphosphoundecaprenol N-acetyl-beta-D-mannosaminyltransferase
MSHSRSAVTLHEYSVLPAVQRYSTHLFRWTTAQVLFTTEFEAARYRESLGRWGAVQQIIPIGSNVPTHPADLARNLNVIYFGQVRPGKGIEEFLELARLSFRLSRPFGFMVVASVPRKHSGYYRTIREQAPSSVQWLIDLPLDDVAKVLASSFAAYLPFPKGASYRSGSMLAAMANGLPVITRAGPATAPELRDVLMLVAGVDEALAHLDGLYDGRESAQAKTSQARRLVKRFSWEEIALRHAEIYSAMLSGRARKENPTLPLANSACRTRAPAAFSVLGVRVDSVQIPDVIEQMERWIAGRSACRCIAFTGMHGISETQDDPSFKQILNSADLVVADGTPLVWLGRWHGHAMRRRVYGPELVQTFCRKTGPLYRHYFYGGGPGVADRLAEILNEQYGVRTVGTYTPPFRPLTEEEKVEVDTRIQAADPDVVWVGLSTPKQERWMFEHRLDLSVPLLAGVGAAFDFIAGTAKQAPAWVQENGLEWFFRFTHEPRRLWRRYLVNGSKFAWNVSLELSGLRKFD